MAKEWTTEEIKILKNNYQKLLNSELGRLIGRSSGSVSVKANKLRLRKSQEFWSEERKRISERMRKSNPMSNPDVAKNHRGCFKKGLTSNNKGKKNYLLTLRNKINNPMNDLNVRNKMINSLKDGYKSGKIKKWQLNHTKDTHPGLMKISNKSKFRTITDEWKHNIRKSHWSKSDKKEEIILRTKHVGEENPNWLGGISFLPYTKDFTKQFKFAIRQRDAFLCLKCGVREEDHRYSFKQSLHIHHIDYIKENTLKENCCALCLRCNVEVNNNRPHWTKFFQSMLAERYGYKYSGNGDIILGVVNEN